MGSVEFFCSNVSLVQRAAEDTVELGKARRQDRRGGIAPVAPRGGVIANQVEAVQFLGRYPGSARHWVLSSSAHLLNFRTD